MTSSTGWIWAGWAALGVAIVVVELIAVRNPSRLTPFGRVVADLRSRAAGRVALVIFWMWFGWHLFAR